MINRLLKKVFYLDVWNIGYINLLQEEQKKFLFLDSKPEVTWLDSPKWDIVADPHLDGDNLYYEHLKRVESNGVIKRLNLSTGLTETVLQEDFHLSYPNIINYKNELYLMPESGASGSTRIYKYNKSAQKFEKFRVIDLALIDGTLLEFGNKIYIFGRLYNDDEGILRVWYSDSLNDEFREQSNSPYFLGNEYARQGGSFLKFEGDYYRVSQSCKNGYGEFIGLHKIIKLDSEHYEESFVTRIAPFSNDYPSGLHTLSQNECWTVIDGKSQKFHLFAWLFKFKNIIFSSRSS